MRRSPGEKYHPESVVQTVKHPTKVMIWSVLSGKGTGRLYVVQGMMKQDQYKQMLMDRVLPHVRDWFPNGESSFSCKMALPATLLVQ